MSKNNITERNRSVSSGVHEEESIKGKNQRDADDGKTVSDIKTTSLQENESCENSWNSFKCYRNILTFSLAIGFANMATNTLQPYTISQITTLERQFGLSSGESGIILISNEIGFLLAVLFFGHFGPRCHIPRLLSVTTFLCGVSGLLSSLPYFISSTGISINENSTRNSTEYGLCRHDGVLNNELCDDEDNTNEYTVKWVIVFFGLSRIVLGVCKSPSIPLPTLYIDNNTEKTRTGFYLGVKATLSICGPFFAPLLGGLFGQIPVDLQETMMTPEDYRWLGAWWVGFLLLGCICIIASLPLPFFPRRFKSASVETEEQEREINSRNNESCFDTTKDTFYIKTLLKGLYTVIKRPVYDLSLLSLVCLLFAVVGRNIFGPKYIENQFYLPTGYTNIILGVQQMTAGLLGLFLGGYITSRMRMDRRKCLKMVIIFGFIAASLTALEYIFGCGNVAVRGIDGNISHCNCDGIAYQAVCGSDNSTYITPCHAGCKNVTDDIYGGCEVLPGEQTATRGVCNTGCKSIYPFVVVSMLALLASNMTLMPLYLVFLRSVPQDKRALGFSIVSASFSVFVLIPSPIAFGKVFDSTCRIWRKTCGELGACGLYDIVKMRYYVISIDVGLRICGIVFAIMAFIIATRHDKCNKDEETKEPQNVKMEKYTRKHFECYTGPV